MSDANAVAVPTSNLAAGCHYHRNGSGMIRIGERVAGATIELLSRQEQ